MKRKIVLKHKNVCCSMYHKTILCFSPICWVQFLSKDYLADVGISFSIKIRWKHRKLSSLNISHNDKSKLESQNASIFFSLRCCTPRYAHVTHRFVVFSIQLLTWIALRRDYSIHTWLPMSNFLTSSRKPKRFISDFGESISLSHISVPLRRPFFYLFS